MLKDKKLKLNTEVKTHKLIETDVSVANFLTKR